MSWVMMGELGTYVRKQIAAVLEPRARRSLIICHDIVMTFAALIAAYWLRFGAEFVQYLAQSSSMAAMGVLLAAAVIVYRFFRLYAGNWRFASVPDLIAIVQSATLLSILLLALDYFSRGAVLIPRGVIIAYWMILIFSLGAPRLLYRAYRDRRRRRRAQRRSTDESLLLVAGMGDEAELFIRRLEQQPQTKMRIVGLLTNKAVHVREHIRSIPVVGLTTDLPGVMRQLEASGRRPNRLVLTAEALALGEQAAALMRAARQLKLPVNRLSSLELHAGQAAVSLARVDMEDLLIRPAAQTDIEEMRRLITGRTVLVTGGGGSIGGEICRQVAILGARRLIIVENSELALYKIQEQLALSHPELPLEGKLVDICDRESVGALFNIEKPELVFHAAALKHVHLVEANKSAAFLTNTIGTEIIADAALKHGAMAMVMISTDKAVQPASFLGASKRAAELYCQALDAELRKRDGRHGEGLGAARATRFISVRFGNVLGSTGSVVWAFKAQIERGGPLRVTHPDMERYFMTIAEATSLVLVAAAHGLNDAEAATSIYVLDMGNPIKILDLAHRMVGLAGLTLGEDIELEYTGLRPGERLSERLFHGDELVDALAVPGIMAARPNYPEWKQIGRLFQHLKHLVAQRQEDALVAALQELIPDYKPADSPVTHAKLDLQAHGERPSETNGEQLVEKPLYSASADGHGAASSSENDAGHAASEMIARRVKLAGRAADRHGEPRPEPGKLGQGE